VRAIGRKKQTRKQFRARSLPRTGAPYDRDLVILCPSRNCGGRSDDSYTVSSHLAPLGAKPVCTVRWTYALRDMSWSNAHFGVRAFKAVQERRSPPYRHERPQDRTSLTSGGTSIGLAGDALVLPSSGRFHVRSSVSFEQRERQLKRQRIVAVAPLVLQVGGRGGGGVG